MLMSFQTTVLKVVNKATALVGDETVTHCCEYIVVKIGKH